MKNVHFLSISEKSHGFGSIWDVWGLLPKPDFGVLGFSRKPEKWFIVFSKVSLKVSLKVDIKYKQWYNQYQKIWLGYNFNINTISHLSL